MNDPLLIAVIIRILLVLILGTAVLVITQRSLRSLFTIYSIQSLLLALLALGVKGIRLGPTLPAFLSPGVAKVLVENFNIRPTTEPAADVEAMMKGQ